MAYLTSQRSIFHETEKTRLVIIPGVIEHLDHAVH